MAHRRDPARHRAAILDATRAALAEHGYARTTIRDVAHRAGVSHGLVMRHFGSKEGLLRAALPGPPGIDEVMEGEPATLPDRIAERFLERMESAGAEDPLLALVRSAATNEAAAGLLYVEMRRRSAEALTRVVGPAADLDVRADLVSAVLIGVTFERYVVRRGTLAELDVAGLRRWIAGLLRHVLGPVLPGAGAAAASPPPG